MHARELLSEAWRNVTSGTTRVFLLGAMLTALLLTMIGADAVALRDLLREERAILTDSGATWAISAPGRIDGAACAALGRIPGVRGSVALRRDPDGLRLPALRGAEPSLFDAAGDAGATFGAGATVRTGLRDPRRTEPESPPQGTPGDPGPSRTERASADGLVLSGALAERLHANKSRPLILEQADGSVAAVPVQQIVEIRDGDRGTSISVAAFAPVPASGYFDICYATVWPADARIEALLPAVAERGGEESTEVSVLNPSARPAQSLRERATQRLTRPAAPLAVLGGLVLGVAAVRSRRTELALARQLGQSRRALTTQILAETTLWMGTACTISGLVITQVVLRDVDAASAGFLLRDLLLTIGATAAATLLGAGVSTWHVSPRHLIRWARDR